MRSTHPYVRAGTTLVAQSLASVTNFAANALALSSGDLASYGRFAIGFQLCQVVVVVANGSLGDVVLIHTSRAEGDESASDLRDGAMSAALLIGLAASGLFVVGAVLAPELRSALLLGALGSPAIVAQYGLRARRYAADDPGGVMRADLIWLLVVVAGAVLDAIGWWDASPDGYLAVWLLGAAFGGAPAILTGLTRGRHHARSFLATTRAQLLRLGAESLLARSVFVVSLIATEIVIDTTASGALAAAVLVFSPMTVVHTGVSAIVVPREVAARGIHVVRRSVPLRATGAVIVITLVWAAVIWGIDTLDLGRGPFDLAPNGVTGLLFIATLFRFIGLAVWRGPLIGLRIADAAGDSLRVRLVGTSAQWVFPIVGLLVGDLEGGAAGLALGTFVGASEAWRRYLGLSPTT